MDPFVAEIRIFGFNFAPKGWALCDGQTLPISQNTALFSLIGTFYGGDGKTFFALPNLQGSVPIHAGGGGAGPGLSTYFVGESGGTETVTVLQSEMPAHNHTVKASSQQSDLKLAQPDRVIGRSVNGQIYEQPPFTNYNQMDFRAIGLSGGSLPHNNVMPYLTFNFCIALQGVFPPRS